MGNEIVVSLLVVVVGVVYKKLLYDKIVFGICWDYSDNLVEEQKYDFLYWLCLESQDDYSCDI